MAINKRGRKAIPAGEKKVPVKIWVKQKHFKQAKAECDAIERKYNTNES